MTKKEAAITEHDDLIEQYEEVDWDLLPDWIRELVKDTDPLTD